MLSEYGLECFSLKKPTVLSNEHFRTSRMASVGRISGMHGIFFLNVVQQIPVGYGLSESCTAEYGLAESDFAGMSFPLLCMWALWRHGDSNLKSSSGISSYLLILCHETVKIQRVPTKTPMWSSIAKCSARTNDWKGSVTFYINNAIGQ